jgi:ribonuclease BN (tRNA processing enzyme)
LYWRDVDSVEQGFLCSIGLHFAKSKAPAAAAVATAEAANEPDEDEHEGGHETHDFSPTQKYFEIVGPQHLAVFLRTALTCSDSHFPWTYHVTELLPAGSPVPHVEQLHGNEAPPTFILPEADGSYTVLAGHASGITVRAATLTHRVFCLGYTLTEPHRPGR